MDEIAIQPCRDDTVNNPQREFPSLRKASRAGGPVTCVCILRRPRQNLPTATPADAPPSSSSSSSSPLLAKIWALGPYLYCSRGDDDDNDIVKDELLVFPQHNGGSIHGISFRGGGGGYNDNNESSTCGHQEEDYFEVETFSSWDAVVYGGRQLAFCRIPLQRDNRRAAEGDTSPKKKKKKKNMKRLEIHHRDRTRKSHLIATDWIWDVKLLEVHKDKDLSSTTLDGGTGDHCTMVLGMARNTIELWNVSSSSHLDDDHEAGVSLQVTCQRRIAATPSCLVMSMNIMFQPEDNRLMIASGTAFQVIQVWSVPLCYGQEEDEAATAVVKDIVSGYRLEGHAGIIHAVQFSPDGKYIASTSDDRSVRLWSCENRSVQWVGWGHTARVWSVAFLVDTTDAVVSVAEDATVRIWSLESGAPLACIQHSTGLWSVTTWKDLAMVGATDGTVSVYNLAKRIRGRELEVSESISIPDDRLPIIPHTIENSTTTDSAVLSCPGSTATATKKRKPPKVQPQVIVGMKWMHGGKNVVVATRAGSLMMWNMECHEWNQYEPWWTPALMETYGISAADGCFMEVLKQDWVAIGTTRGHVVIVKCISNKVDASEEVPRLVLAAPSLKSVKGLTWIAEQQTLLSFHVRSVALWHLPDEDSAMKSLPSPSITLNVDAKSVPISSAYDEDRKQVLVGDSRGNIALFNIPEVLPEQGSLVLNATSVIARIHQKEHVTSILLVGDKILSSGNDGSLHTSYRMGSSLQRGISVPVWSMSGITRVWSYEDNRPAHSKKYIVAGFYGNNFRVLDSSTGHELFQLDTGGRQRIHDFFIAETDLKHMAVCMNQKDGTNSLMIQREVETKGDPPSYRNSMLDSHKGVPIHGETIFDACFFTLNTHDGDTFLLTASEDCGSKISFCHKNHPTDIIALTPQESCVRTVCSSQIDATSALLVVGGGKLALQFFLATSRKENGLPVNSLDDVGLYFLGKGHGFASGEASIDQRINTAKGIPLNGPIRSHFVVAGDSAGQCYLNIISEDANVRPGPGLIVQVSSRPILCLAMSQVGNRVLLAIGTTAGDVQLYDLPGSATSLQDDWSKLGSKPWIPLATFQAHQMGTNAISLSIENTGDTTAQATIFTGGDDQAVSLYRLGFHMTSADATSLVLFEPCFTSTVRGASFSAIKGVSGPYYSDHTKCKYFLSAGYTQQLALWKLVESTSGGEPQLEVVKHLPVDVGDINTLATCNLAGRNDGILATVAGLGIEMFCLKV